MQICDQLATVELPSLSPQIGYRVTERALGGAGTHEFARGGAEGV